MPHWIIKAAIQGTISKLPDPQRWNRLFQKYVTHSLDLGDEYFLSKWEQCEKHMVNYCKHSGEEAPAFTALEIGTGWFPVVPIGMALNGATKFYSIDMQDLLKHECVIKTLERYQTHLKSGRVTMRRDDALERVEALLAQKDKLSAREILSDLGIESVIRDARDSKLPGDSIDLICSTNTLEHIPRDIVAGILKEFSRLSSSRGIMSHHIDLADHYVNFDKSITVYNFLKYSESRWAWFNNDLQYVNRLRVSDFRELHSESGWKIGSEDNQSEAIEVLRSIKLDREFEKYSEEDLAVYVTWMVSQAVRHSGTTTN